MKEAMIDKVNASGSFVIPFGFWAYAHIAELTQVAQLILFCVGIIGGIPAAWKGIKFVKESLKQKKDKTP